MPNANHVDDYIDHQLQTGPQLMANKARKPSGRPYLDRAIKLKIDEHIKGFYANPDTASRWLIMPGLRGVGKTTVLAQTYLRLQSQTAHPRPNLLYLSVDDCVNELRANLSDILAAYGRRLGQSWVYLDKPTFILIDEIQADTKWATTLKSIYEKTRQVFFICTGSSAVALQVSPNAARRSTVERLYPLNFGEYQLLAHDIWPSKGLKNELIEAIYYARSARHLNTKLKDMAPKIRQQWGQYDSTSLDQYLARGTMPSALVETGENSVFYQKLRQTIDQVLVTDLPAIRHFDHGTIANIKRLLFLLADTSSVIATNKLNQTLGTTSRQIQAIFDALTKAEILIKVPAWGDHFASTRKPPRYFFMSPAIRAAYQSLVSQAATRGARQGQLLEDLAALHYYREFVNRNRRGELTHFYDKNAESQPGCDFILKLAGSHQLAIEFSIGPKDTSQVRQTMTRADCRYGIVFADSPLALDLDGQVVTIPLNYFYLM